MGYMYSMNRKKHQRMINREVRYLNKSIENDNLWRGRFVCRQKEAFFYIYEDKSGATLSVCLEFIDKKTGQREEFYINSGYLSSSFGSSRLFWAMNSFIVETCDAWRKEDPRLDKTDYRKIKI